jgi:glycine/D-amino acid oxidase-like deaminating enzyme
VREPPASLWWSTLPAPVVPRPALGGDLDVDVAIVGGGYTGLWTALSLLSANPSLRVVVLEQSVCGFGASGRNGGWASALYPVSHTTVTRRWGAPAADHLRRSLRLAVTELGEVSAAEGIDAHYHRGGTLIFARNDVQETRLRDEVASGSDPDLAWLDQDEALARGRLPGVRGATFTPHCARIHPARLVRGLSDAVANLGGRIFEGTAVSRIDPATPRRRARAVTPRGTVRADVVVRATEGFSARFAGHQRDAAPLYSLMIATEPQSDAFWNEYGFADAETFADDRHLIIYGQRTADGRIAFGGRGAPYHFGSAVEERFDHDARVFSRIEATVRELFPTLEGSITHRWGGPLAMPRDHEPSVVLDRTRGLGVAGGYTGDGVVLSFVAGRALAALILGEGGDERAQLPFVHHTSRRWEPEPLRWVGINAGLSLAGRADDEETAGRDSRAGGALRRLLT